ncbi:uncharacterized protein M421DRAFT_93796 [Didymella exigua CBS 183.55]|uniref:F-box domain-containing protein n=1 Tax=Didymella exigua CBS 183.55 TaxID=1150837 RepID=A0A6A5RFM6_9PLEO|nr:uncharacterized protein M421DRAFT_93796 [Didymella exigua CBS 183.55]KAF1926532.1 hypothetical protein M421DRAFT_93796 [Didymella exigua CBS 183.55]
MMQIVTSGLKFLPNELLDCVSTLLDRPSLYALSLVCKKTATSANVALYNEYANNDPPSETPFHLFLRTMCEVPHLASLVKRVHVRGWRSEFEVGTGAAWRGVTTFPDVPKNVTPRGKPSFSSVDRAPKVASNQFEVFLETAIRSGLIERPALTTPTVDPLKPRLRWDKVLNKDEDFARLLKRDVEDAHFVLLCALLPKLGRLTVGGLSLCPMLDWYTFLYSSEGALQNVGRLAICGSLPWPGEPVLKTTMQVLDILPNLQLLYLGNMSV